MTIDDYRTWLGTQKYSKSTIDASLKVLRRLDLENPKPANRVDAFLLRRYLRYVKETRRNPLGRKFTEALASLGLDATKPRAVYGARKRKLLSADKFYALRAACLGSEDNATRLVAFYMMTDKKPREFLEQLTSRRPTSEHKGAYSDVFRVRRGIRVYEILSPSFTWAYRMMLAAAKAQGRLLDIDVDLDILYRTRLQLR